MLRYSLHKISSPESLSFSPVEYSKFKFGDNMVAKDFGISLAQEYIKSLLSKVYNGQQIVVITSPYNFIPTATFCLVREFVQHLNCWLVDQGYPVSQQAKIHRTSTYSQDYGNLSAIERTNLIGKDDFYIDKEFVKGKLLLLLDDIRITGSHERVVLKLLSKVGVEDFHLLYFAELTNFNIPPTIENDLNYAFVTSIWKLNEIIQNGIFEFNTRAVKYILNSEEEGFRAFIEEQDLNFLENLYFNAIGNSYHTVYEYQKNLNYLKQILNKNKIALWQ